jgi:filamentous hemagglutinin family protein
MRPQALKPKCRKSIRNRTIPGDVVNPVSGIFKAAILHAGTLASVLALLSALAVTPSHALPQNGSVAGGSATISQPNSTTMNINQTSGNAIINWQGYSIGANESVKYIQPGSSSIALNRVTGVDPSYIYGLLSGNGQVWVINPNGLLVGPGATVQTGSFLASTMNITNENFMSGAYNFTNTRDSQASIINQGHIQTANGGYVVLAAPSVTNSGSIVANLGSVHLASGDAITLSIDNGSLINVAVRGDVAAAALGVTNTGQITANGGQVVLTARVAGDIMKNIVNNEGIIEAKSISEKDGIITLDGGSHGITANSGTLDASGKNPGETGGKVTVVGDKVGLFAGSTVDVSGDAGGGTVLIGGNFHGAGPERNASMTYVDKNAAIKADALVNGDGGTVVVWSDDATRFYGNISAKGGVQGGDGGSVETSGKQYLVFKGFVDARAPNGKTGTLLLDPTDVTIDSVGPTTPTYTNVANTFADSGANASTVLLNTDLQTALSGASITVSTAGGGGSTGTILVSAPVTWANSNGLTLSAASTISVNAPINGGATSSLTLNAGGAISQTAAGVITTGTLNTNATGGTALNTATNAVNTFIASDSGGTISLTNIAPTLALGAISGTGATINTTGNLSLTGAVNVGGGTLGLTFGENGAGRTLDLSAAGTLTAGTITATGTAGGTNTIKVTDNAAALTLTNASYVGTNTFALSNINTAILTGGAGANDINVSGWNGGRTASINVSTGADTITGNGANTTLIGPNTGSTFTLNGPNSGGVNGTTIFSAVGNLSGGTGPDLFTLDSGVTTFNGSIAGGGGTDRLSVTNGANAWQVSGTSTGTLNTTTAFSGIANLSGGTGTDTLTGVAGGNNWTITGAKAVTVSGMNGTSMDALAGGAGADIFTLDPGVPTFNGSIAGGGGTNTLAVTNGANAWQVTGANAGTLNTTTTFSGIANLSGGTGTDTLTDVAGGGNWSITGTKAVTIWSLNGTSMDALVGGPGSDTFTLGPGVTTFNGSIAGGGGTDTLAVTNGTNAWQVTGANAGRLNATTTFSAIANLSGGIDTDTLTGVTGGGSWSITGGKTVTVSGMDGTSMDALIGGSGADIFTLAPGVTTFNGSIAGGGGIDTLAVTDGTNSWKSTGANAGTLNTTTIFSAITNLNGSGTDTLTGTNAVNAWRITGTNSVSLDGMNATGINALLGGSGADTFTLASGLLNFNGSIAGGGGIDTLATTNGTNAWQVTGPNTGTLNTTSTFTGIANLAGGVGIDTLTAAGQTYTLDNSTANKGSNGLVAWTSIENLTDTGTGIFNMGTGGSVTGSLDGGSGGTLNYGSYTNPVTLNLGGIGTTGIGSTWSHIATVTGNAATSNTVIGSNKIYLLDNSTQNKGSNGGVTWSDFKNITDTGTGTFNMGTGGSVSGNLDGGIGGTLNYSSYINPVTLNLGGTATTGITTGTWSGITTVTGSSNNDTISGTGKSYNLTAATVGNSSGVSWTSFEKIADSGTGTIITTGGQTYNLAGANSGNVATLLPGGFTGISNLIDSDAGVFNMHNGIDGSVSGTISATGGKLDYTGYGSAVTFGLSGTATGTGGWTGSIASVVGSSNSDTISGTGKTYTLTGTNAGNSSGTGWTSFEQIANSGTGTIVTTGGRMYTLTGANSGSVAGLLPGGFTGIGNLTDSGAGTFRFAAGGSLTGNITAAGGVLDYSAGIAGPVTVDLTTKTGSGIGGSWNGITTVTGSGASDTMGGATATYTLTAPDAGTSGGVSWSSFENLHDTAAGIFRFAAGGSVTGGITAAGGTLDYSAGIAGPVTVDLTAKTGSGIGGSWNGITTVTGSGASDTMGSANATYNLTAANAGTSGGVSWSSFEKIADSGSGTISTTGGQTYNLTGANSGNVALLLPGGYTGIGNLTDSGGGIFTFGTAGSVAGNITAVGGTLDYSVHATAVNVNLAGSAGTSTGIGGTWSGITSVIGSSSTADTITGSSQTYILDNGTANKGSAAGVAWSAIENLTDTGTGIFNMGTGGHVTGSLNGGSGGTLNYSSYSSHMTLNLAGTGTTGIDGAWSNIATVTGNSANVNSVTGLNKTYTLDNSTANKGSSGSVNWTDFRNITDTGTGIFNMGTGGSVTGNLDGGSGGTLNYGSYGSPVTLNLAGTGTTGITTGTWSHIGIVTGNSSTSNTVTGLNKSYTLDNSFANKGSSGGVTWTDFRNLTDTGTGTFNMGTGGSITGSLDGGSGGTLNYGSYTNPVTLNLAGTGTTGIGSAWSHIATVTGNAATSNTVTGLNKTYTLDNSSANKGSSGGVTWTDFRNITDTGSGTFNMGTGGSISGNLDGGIGSTVDYSSYSGPVALNLDGTGTTGIGSAWSHIASVTGSSNSDTIGGTGKTYSLTAPNTGTSGGVSWTSFEKIADAGAGTITTTGGQTYNLTGANSGTVATLLPGGYAGIGNLADTGAGTFRFAAGGSVTGNITAAGGVLDYSAGIAGPVTVDLTAKTGSGIGGSWNGITTVTGSVASDTMGGANATYTLTSANAGTDGGISWSSFEKIADGGIGTIATTGGRTYTLTGANSGNVAGLLPGGYRGIGNLTDSGASIFQFAAGGSVTGNITAAGGLLDYSAGIAGPVTVDLTTKTGSGIGGSWSGITTVTGSGASDTMGGANATYTLTAVNAGTSGGVSWSSFENLHDTAAGIYRFAAGGSVTGGITAAGGTLDYSGLTGPVAVDLTAKTGPGIGTTWNGIALVTGSAHTSDTITGSGQTFNVTGDNAGNNGSVSWTSFENINGLTGANLYVGSGGSLSGSIVDAGTGATLHGTIQTGGAQTYAGAVTLGAATTLTSTGSGSITFAGTLDSDSTPRDLTVATSGITTFSGAVGTTPLNSLTITGGGTTNITGGSVTTSGLPGQVYNSAVVLGGNTSLNADSGAIILGSAGSLTTAGLLTTRSSNGQTLVGNGTNSVAGFSATNTTSGDITLTNSATPLTIAGISQTGGQLIITNSGEITSSGPLTVTGNTVITATGQPITLANANNDFGGTVTVTGAVTSITDKNNLAVVLNTTGPTTLTAGADMSMSGISTDSVTATAAGTVTVSNPAASILHITGATIVGTMSNPTPLDLTTTSDQTPITVNLTGSLPFLTFAGDVRTNIRSLGLYNGAVVMGSEMDHFKSMMDLRASITALASDTEQSETVGKLARFDGFFEAVPKESIIDSKGAFNAPEAEPTLIDF